MAISSPPAPTWRDIAMTRVLTSLVLLGRMRAHCTPSCARLLRPAGTLWYPHAVIAQRVSARRRIGPRGPADQAVAPYRPRLPRPGLASRWHGPAAGERLTRRARHFCPRR